MLGIYNPVGSGSGVSPAQRGKVSPLGVGSPVVLTVEPPYLKTAEPMPMMKANDGILKVGHAGRY